MQHWGQLLDDQLHELHPPINALQDWDEFQDEELRNVHEEQRAAAEGWHAREPRRSRSPVRRGPSPLRAPPIGRSSLDVACPVCTVDVGTFDITEEAGPSTLYLM